jgi:uncharacterized protein (TIGR02996 family)
VTVTTTIAAMLAAVRESPESMADDTLRLVLADALQDTDPDEGGDADWAEFIRAGVEFERGCETCEYGDYLAWRKKPTRLCPWCVRETKRLDALLDAHEARWRRGPACERCAWSGRVNSDKPFRYTEPCPDCRGSGWTGPLGELGERGLSIGNIAPPWRVPAEFRRGFIHRVETPLADVFQGDTVTPWAVRVARWPQVCLEEWGVTDREPEFGPSLRNVNDVIYSWYGCKEWPPPYREIDSDDVPLIVVANMIASGDAAAVLCDDDGGWAEFEPGTTPDAARHALARAVAAVVNEAARERG